MIYTFNNVELDTENFRLLVEGIEQSVEPQVFDLIVYLIQNRDKVSSRDEILKHVWKDRVVSDSSISNHIKTARKILGDDGIKQQVIKTIHSRGYQFIAECQELNDLGSNEETQTAKNKYSLLLLVILFLIIGFIIIKQYQSSNIPTEIVDNSIAVLAFEDLSPNADQNYFAEGLSEELLNMFTRIADLRVSSRTSSFSYKDKDMKLEEIGKELNVKYIMEGSVRKAENKLRVTAQLIKVSNGSHLWSEAYDYELQDIFKIQDEISKAVSEQLQISLLKENTRKTLNNPEAHSLYLKGLYHFRLKTPEGLKLALDLITQSIVIDEKNSNAWVLKSRIYYNLNQFSYDIQNDGLIKLARESAIKAKELNSRNAMANAQMALINLWDYDFESAHFNIELAMSADYKNTSTIEILSHYYLLTGQIDKSIELLEQTIEQDPVVDTHFYQLGVAYFYNNKLKEAFNTMNKYHYFHSQAHNFLGLISQIYLAAGKSDRAIEYANEEPNKFYKLYSNYFISHASGENQQANEILNDLIINYSKSPAYIASLYAYRKDAENTFKWLETALNIRDTELLLVINSLHFRNVWKDSRWEVFLHKMKLPVNHWLFREN